LAAVAEYNETKYKIEQEKQEPEIWVNLCKTKSWGECETKTKYLLSLTYRAMLTKKQDIENRRQSGRLKLLADTTQHTLIGVFLIRRN